jgi:hypothetical protein
MSFRRMNGPHDLLLVLHVSLVCDLVFKQWKWEEL